MCRLDQHFCTKFIQFIKFFNLNSIESILFSINLKTKQEYFAMQNMADFFNINILFVDQQNNVFPLNNVLPLKDIRVESLGDKNTLDKNELRQTFTLKKQVYFKPKNMFFRKRKK